LEYGGTFTKLFMHVSSRNMFPTIRNLQIHVHVYYPRHCCGDWLTFGCFVPMWPRDEKINNHGCWGRHAHIPDNDYWGICLFHVVWTIFFLVQLFLCGTHGIYFYLHPTFFSSTKQCAWAIIRKSSNLESHAYHSHYCTGKLIYLLSNILRFPLKICFWADF
jgi:hypothetical protein